MLYVLLQGYSALAVASALAPDAKVYTIERDADTAEIARRNIAARCC